MSRHVHVYFGSASNLAHFAIDWSESHRSSAAKIQVHDDYCELTVMDDDEEELADTASRYSGVIEDAPQEDGR